MGFGEFLKGCRKNSKKTQSELAMELGLNQSDVSKIETDSRIPDADIFRDWTIATQSADLAVAFLYGAELLINVSDVITNTVVSFINFM